MFGVLASQFCLCQWEHNFARQCNRINANRFRAKWIANSIPRRVATLCPCRFPSHFRRFVVFATLFMVRVVHPEIGTQAFVRLNVTLVFCDGEQIFEKHLMDKKWMQMWLILQHQHAPANFHTVSTSVLCDATCVLGKCVMTTTPQNFVPQFLLCVAVLHDLWPWSPMFRRWVEAWETWKQKTADMQRTRITSRSLYILGKSWRILRVADLNFRQHIYIYIYFFFSVLQNIFFWSKNFLYIIFKILNYLFYFFRDFGYFDKYLGWNYK